MATKSKNPHAEFHYLLSMMPFQTKESQVYEYSGQTSLSKLYRDNPSLYQKMIRDMRKLTADPELERMNNLRQRVIAAIGQWFTTAGIYGELSREERLLRIKGTAIYAVGSKGGSFNKLTASQLKRVMNGFNDKTKTKRRIDGMRGLLEIDRN